MWKALSTLNVLVTLIITRPAEADYYEYSQSQYKQNTTPFKCIEEGYHPDLHDCRIYYICVNWGNGSPLTTFKFECGVGTVFSKDKGNICTHLGDSGRSECDKSENDLDSNLYESVEYPSPIWTTMRTTTQQQLITTQLPTMRPLTITTKAATTLERFETTTQSLPMNRPTSAQLEHNVINCQNRPQCKQEGFLADTCDCEKFYRCVNEDGKFRKYVFTCGVGTVWDPKIQGCNHVWAVTRSNCRQGLEAAGGINNSGQWNEDNNGQWNNDIENNDGQWNGNINNSGQPDQLEQVGNLNGQMPNHLVSPSTSDSPGYPGIPGSSDNINFPSYPGIAATSDSPDNSEFPGYLETSDSPNISNSIGYPGTPGIPDSPGTASSPETPSKPEIPDSPGYSEISAGTLDSPGTPGVPSLSDYPGTPDYPAASSGFPVTPDSGYPGSPGTPGSLGMSEIPSSPGYPEVTNMPGIPGSQDYPGRPSSSGTSGIPSPSEIPNRPAYPGISSSSGTPSSLGIPEISGSPSYPGIADSPDSTGIPEISSSPNYPGASDMSSNPSSPVHSSNQPLTGPCIKEGFFADSKDCRKFYRCVGDSMSFTKYEFQCGAGTVWDSSIQSCNHAYAIPHCYQSSNAVGNEPDTSLNEIDNINERDTTVVPPVQSSENSTVPSTSSKPETKPSTQAVSTTNKPATSFQTTSVSYLPASTAYPLSTTQITESISFLPPETQMTTSISYFPSSSAATTSTTFGSMPVSVSYLPPDTTTSINMGPITNSPSLVSSTISSPQDGKFKCTEEGFFQNPDDCRKFYRCVQNQSGYQKYNFQCGPGTAWDQFAQTCNHIEKVALCSTNTDEITQSPRPTISNPEPTSSFATIATINQTTTTISSSTLSTTVANTSSQTSIESLTSEVDKTEALSTTIKATSVNTSEKPISGKPESMQIPEDSSTENSFESSSEQSSSESEELSTELHVSNCTTQKPNNTIVCNDEGFFPHPTQCDKFYRCVDNGNGFNVYHFDCPSRTIFDPSINVCNHPESVYPARDCMTGSTASSDIPVKSTTTSETPEQSTQITTTQSIGQQTEENTTTSTEPDMTISTIETIITERSTTVFGTESTTSEMSEITESIIEFTTKSVTTTTEATTDSTSEKTTEFTTESTTISTESTESETSTIEFQQSTTESQGTTEQSQAQSTTESQKPSSTETQEHSTTQSQEQSSTESQEQMTTELPQSTTAPEAVTLCPISNLTDEQIILVCPTGFRRHPKYCNLFYQCTSESNMEIKILVMSCPENTIFDEKKIQCLSASRSSQMCTGAKANARFYRRLEDNALSPMKVSTNQLCPGEGHFPYRQGCSNTFYKCKRDSWDNLQGYFYKCPENFIYWSVSRRCERVARLPMCSYLAYRNETDWNNRWQIPTEDFNLSAKMLRFS